MLNGSLDMWYKLTDMGMCMLYSASFAMWVVWTEYRHIYIRDNYIGTIWLCVYMINIVGEDHMCVKHMLHERNKE